MIRKEELALMRAVAICHKPYLKPEEALIYCNLRRTNSQTKCGEFGVWENNSGYFKREEPDRMLSRIRAEQYFQPFLSGHLCLFTGKIILSSSCRSILLAAWKSLMKRV